VHNWIANPKRYLPYTGMPVNIPFDKPVSQDLYPGSSEQQVDALTDLLMHFDTFAKKNLSLDPYLRQSVPAAPAPAAGVAPQLPPSVAVPAADQPGSAGISSPADNASGAAVAPVLAPPADAAFSGSRQIEISRESAAALN